MRSLDSQRDYWNDVGPTKTFAHPVNFERLALHLRPESRILDYGCGYGRVVGLPDGQRALVAEVSRVLRPGGLFYVSDLWLQSDARNRERYDRGRVKYGTYGCFELDEGVVLRHQESQSFAALTAAYDTVASEPDVFETMNGHQAEGFQRFGTKTRGT